MFMRPLLPGSSEVIRRSEAAGETTIHRTNAVPLNAAHPIDPETVEAGRETLNLLLVKAAQYADFSLHTPTVLIVQSHNLPTSCKKVMHSFCPTLRINFPPLLTETAVSHSNVP